MSTTHSRPSPAIDDLPLSERIVGLSISESPDLAQLGLGSMHLNSGYSELARQLLAAGASLAYGGDHRRQGFTELLFDLLHTYDHPEKPPPERVRNYLAWPIYLQLTVSERARLAPVATLIEVPPPPDLQIDPKTPLRPDTTENRYVWARCLTAMREKMNADLGARVLLGGRVLGFIGKYPGLVEEAHLAIRAGKPLYLLGGFGGCTRAISEAILGGQPEELTGRQQMHDAGYAAMVNLYNRQHKPPIDYAAVLADFNRAGIAGLKNGLDEDENRRLFETDDVDEMISLVLKGLIG